VIKFGFPIGTAKVAIARGAHVHSHNMATALSAEGGHDYRPAADPATPARAFFDPARLRAKRACGSGSDGDI
jgi:altronate hydrolase